MYNFCMKKLGIMVFVYFYCVALHGGHNFEVGKKYSNSSLNIDMQGGSFSDSESYNSFYASENIYFSYFFVYKDFYIGLSLDKSSFQSKDQKYVLNEQSLNIAVEQKNQNYLKLKYLIYSYKDLAILGGLNFGKASTKFNINAKEVQTTYEQEGFEVIKIFYEGQELPGNYDEIYLNKICPLGYEGTPPIYDAVENLSIFFDGDLICKSIILKDKEVKKEAKFKDVILKEQFYIGANLELQYYFNKYIGVSSGVGVFTLKHVEIDKVFGEHTNFKAKTSQLFVNYNIGLIFMLS
jgi:hypothetical protein